jgi:hypothetical protein
MTASKPWEVVETEKGDVHVVPLNDKKEHTLLTDCSCGPRIDVEGAKLIIVHNAWDWREIVEEAAQIGGE